MSSHELRHDKKTDAKHRWIDVDDAGFKFYIPQAVLPQEHPQRIRVRVETDPRQAASFKANLKAVVELGEEHSETVQYAPVGDPDTWQIGRPYIPKTALTEPWPVRLHIAVSWDSP